MNTEDIKVGETYYVRVKVTATSENRFVCRPMLWGCTLSNFAPNFFNFAEAEAFFKSIPEQPEQPKHDPCRLFRKGDIVRLKEWNGRCPALPEDWKRNDGLFKVHEDEKFNSSVEITRESSKNVYIAPICFLELVTPVEELKPYRIGKSDYNGFVNIEKKGKIIAMIPYGKELHEHKTEKEALAAAEAERDRLNAEYRKEQK